MTAQRYEIDVEFAPERGWLRAKAAVTVKAEAGTKAIEFELNRNLKIAEVRDAAGRTLEFVRDGRMGSPGLLVELAEAVVAGEAEQRVRLTFVYEGVMPRRVFDYITEDGILLRDESRWYPVVDLAAFTVNQWRVKLPSDWSVFVGGMKRFEDESRETAEFVSKSRRPISSRAITGIPRRRFVCKRFGTSRSHSDPSLLNANWWTHSIAWPAMDAQGAKDRFGGREFDSNKALISFEAILGFIPTPDIYILEGFPGTQGVLGYSGPGFVVMSTEAVTRSLEGTLEPEFIPHEVAHQWFPIEVTMESRADGWMAESLAEFLAWRYLQAKKPEQAREMIERATAEALEPFEKGRAVFPLREGLGLFRLGAEEAHRTLYSRGMLVWRTLETVIDRERVDAALREYYKRYRGREATIGDFQKICEEISGRKLDWFFEYYIRGTKLPEISLRRLPGSTANELAGEIVVGNVPADFSVRVEMRIETEAGMVEHSLATRGERTPFAVNVKGRVRSVRLDPERRVLRMSKAAERPAVSPR